MKFLNKKWSKVIIVFLSVLIIISTGFYIYTLDYYHALPMVEEELETEEIKYEMKKNSLVFYPDNPDSKTGVIFYPGGKVDYLSYIPLMKSIAKEGYTSVLMKMPFNLAVFNANAAQRPIKAYDGVDSWYIVGHSLGGAMASNYVSKNEGKVDGIVLLGAYPSSDLSSLDIRMLSIYGTEDKILNRESFEENKKNEPQDTRYYEIKGGNHAYYGSYGEQDKDGSASISPQEQQDITLREIVSFIEDK